MSTDDEITVPMAVPESESPEILTSGTGIGIPFNADSLSRLLDTMQTAVVYLRSEYDKVKIRSDEDPKKQALYEAVNSVFRSAMSLLKVLPYLSR